MIRKLVQVVVNSRIFKIFNVLVFDGLIVLKIVRINLVILS